MIRRVIRKIDREIGWRRPVVSALCLILIALFFRDWRHAQPYNDGTWARVQQTGVLRVGMDASYPPFSDTPAGTPTGLDVDLANEIGRRLGVHVQIANMGFDGLYYALQTNQVDVLISALSTDPTKLGYVLYSRGYLDAGEVLASRDGRYNTMPDLDGHTVAVEYGSAGDEQARLWQRRLHLLKIVRFTTPDEAMFAAMNGDADAALSDSVTLRLFVHAHPGLQISPVLVTHEPYSVAVRLSSYDLAGAINDALNRMELDGTLDAIINRWI